MDNPDKLFNRVTYIGKDGAEIQADDYDLQTPVGEERRGGRLGDMRYVIIRPENPPLRRVGSGMLEATEAAEVPESRLSQAAYWTKRALIGVPLASAKAEHERLSKFKALPLLSSDAISSVAFATEAILINLAAAGPAHLGLALPISLVIILLLCIVTISYRQTIPAYPNGGGSYTVARENLGKLPGLVAAAALLIDYVLNVAVCISAGVLNMVSLFPELHGSIVLLDIALVVLVTLLNLRGVRESGSIFAFPTYFFVINATLLIGVGLFKAYVIHHQPIIGTFAPMKDTVFEPLTVLLVLRAFATGCSAMTGVEAISNGVPIFKKPETRNASTTLTIMAFILGTLFLGITLLAMTYGIEAHPSGNPTVVAQIALKVYSNSGPFIVLFPIFQLAVLGILALSAETSYADFPRLASLLAHDGFLPRQFSFRGDRLAFSVGIIALAVMSCILLIVFEGSTNALINLFAVGVFIAFTLSQAGMVMHWWRLRGTVKNWRRSIMINGLGAGTTAIVAMIIAAMKFVEGAWIVILLIPLLVLMFLGIEHHYHVFESERTTDVPAQPQQIKHRVIIPIDRLDRVTIQSLSYARSITRHVTAVHVVVNEESALKIRQDWMKWQQYIGEDEETHLLLIESPYRSLFRPLLAYIDTIRKRHPDETLSVILPEFVVAHWWEYFLHNQTVLRLKAKLLFRPGIVVINLPQHIRGKQPALRPLPW
ncbi:amino acid permease [Ktedonobacter sp. SOSP1-85]|uniref:APC family permease n=1 Tax=Ktedonobacter sp. SOSP1-85 TaxID=2778367 RepID=UPI001A198470|nr:APC family permease [Ktedonobacter sp. SOSP1-85]GHO81071.1 amino acid permease [Ktedonobacter sp. SOSP1-85]